MANKGRKIPQPDAHDKIHAVAKAIVGSIPMLGAAASELFSLVIQPSLDARRNVWIQGIADRLTSLEGKVENFKIENLKDNPVFITVVMQASQAAIRNHQQEKLEALRNAVLNSALPTALNEDDQLRFVNLIDTLRPWHLKILALFDDPRTWGTKHNVEWPHWGAGGASNVLEHAFPRLQGQRDLYDQLVTDLYNWGLMSTNHLHVTMTVNGMFESRTTNMGKKFLRFITSPLEDQ